MNSNFKNARKETQGWVFGMGESVTDRKSPKSMAKSSKKAQKSFISRLEDSLEWGDL